MKKADPNQDRTTELKMEQQDKRRHERYRFAESAYADISDRYGFFSTQGRVLNVSHSGMLIECECRLSQALLWKNFEVTLRRIGRFHPSNEEMKGSIVRIANHNRPSYLCLGITFNGELPPASWQKITEKERLLPMTADF